MTDLESLHRAILCDPDCDTLRLAYADALEESGEHERPAYIRFHIGCGTMQWPFDTGPDLGWLPPIPNHTRRERPDRIEYLNGDGLAQSFVFTRGFVSHIELPCAAFMEHAAAIFARHPVTDVRLTDRVPLDDEGAGTYFGRPAGRAENWYWLVGPVRSSLPWEVPIESSGPVLKSFTSESDALDWLSRRCVAFGRRQANLPELARFG